jgi:hypothetical protein
MRLKDWLDGQPKSTQTELTFRVDHKTGKRLVSYATLARASRGDRVSSRLAQIISDLTDGAVSVEELRNPSKGRGSLVRKKRHARSKPRRAA